jgi:CheY-like chemotaxis protein
MLSRVTPAAPLARVLCGFGLLPDCPTLAIQAKVVISNYFLAERRFRMLKETEREQCIHMTRDMALPIMETQSKVTSSAVQVIGLSPKACDGISSKASSAGTADLIAALVCMALLFGAIGFSQLDSDYATATRMSSVIRRAFRIRGPGDARNDAVANGAKLILVAENDDRQRLIAKTTLERYGYNVALADAGPEAVALFRKTAHRVALVILGGADPRSSSQEVVRQLKKIRPDIRILVSRAADEKAPAGSGVAGRIARPFSASPLAEAVKKALSTT